MLIQGFAHISDIQIEVEYGSLVLTQDNMSITLEDDKITKLARFIEDEYENELYLTSNILARKSDITFLSLRDTNYTSISENTVVILSESMCDELVEHLVNMGVA